jgi:murein DD-endopeptidase MepM/ murein hydrolase activator NlpD
VDPEDSPLSGRPYSRLYKGCAVAAILLLLFGGGWAVMWPSGKAGAGPLGAQIELEALNRRLEPTAVASVGNAETAVVAKSLIRAARLDGMDPREILKAAFPEPRRILGMLALNRDIDDFLEYAGRDDAAGKYYREEAKISLEMRPLRGRYEAAFAAAYDDLAESMGAPVLLRRKRPYIAAPGDVWLPPRSDLSQSHPYALDVFFYRVDRNGEAERGPVIHSLYPGIVVAAASDWSGGQGVSKYRGGGLSPASGNGVVVYDPSSRLYCSYFHMSSVAQRTGAVVAAGAALGRGGNSGMNARMAYHGEHVHIEIFDASRNAPLSSAEILDLLRR